MKNELSWDMDNKNGLHNLACAAKINVESQASDDGRHSSSTF